MTLSLIIYDVEDRITRGEMILSRLQRLRTDLPFRSRIAISAATMARNDQIIPSERIEKSIFLVRGQKVMLDANLAELYEVPTKVFNQAVKRNRSRFPADFMF